MPLECESVVAACNVMHVNQSLTVRKRGLLRSSSIFHTFYDDGLHAKREGETRLSRERERERERERDC